MTEKKFKLLVNLYLDKEISARELASLKEAINACPQKRKAFNQFCKIHLAEKQLGLLPHASSCCRKAPAVTPEVSSEPALALWLSKLSSIQYVGLAACFTCLLVVSIAFVQTNQPVSSFQANQQATSPVLPSMNIATSDRSSDLNRSGKNTLLAQASAVAVPVLNQGNGRVMFPSEPLPVLTSTFSSVPVLRASWPNTAEVFSETEADFINAPEPYAPVLWNRSDYRVYPIGNKEVVDFDSSFFRPVRLENSVFDSTGFIVER